MRTLRRLLGKLPGRADALTGTGGAGDGLCNLEEA